MVAELQHQASSSGPSLPRPEVGADRRVRGRGRGRGLRAFPPKPDADVGPRERRNLCIDGFEFVELRSSIKRVTAFSGMQIVCWQSEGVMPFLLKSAKRTGDKTFTGDTRE